jgi:hypothetical protein
MAIKKTKMSLSDNSEYTIIGISCHLSDFRFVHYLNKIRYFNFVRYADFDYEFKNQKEIFYFPLYYFDDKESYTSYYFIANRSEDGILMNEWKNFDFLLITKSILSEEKLKIFYSDIKKIPGILAVSQLHTTNKSEVNNLLTEVEIYVMEYLLLSKKEQNKLPLN